MSDSGQNLIAFFPLFRFQQQIAQTSKPSDIMT